MPRDAKAQATEDSTLYVVKVQDIIDILTAFPKIQMQLIQEATAKRARHKKKIAQVEKKFPVYGTENLMSETGIKKLKKFGFKFDGTTEAPVEVSGKKEDPVDKAQDRLNQKEMQLIVGQVNDEYDMNGLTD